MKIIDLAKICHQANKAYCETIGDDSQVNWEDAPDWQKSSAIKGVKFHLDNPDAGPSASHNSWLKEKIDAGWVYGKIKDPIKKTHHCIVPYKELPREQQLKDFLFINIIFTLRDYVVD